MPNGLGCEGRNRQARNGPKLDYPLLEPATHCGSITSILIFYSKSHQNLAIYPIFCYETLARWPIMTHL